MTQEPFSFIHTADLHFDSSFQGLTNNIDPDTIKKIQNAPYASFRNIVELCIKKRVDFLLISGDLYDSENKSIIAQLQLFKEIKTLSEAGIATYIVYGNHDPIGKWSATLKSPENCFIFSDTIETLTFLKDRHKIADITGYSHAKRHVRENIVTQFPDHDDDVFHIGLIHCSVDTPGSPENYAPCNKSDFLNKNYQYWALGHIHATSILHEKSPLIIYPGNPQGRNFGEIGERGCYYVSVDEKSRIHSEWIATDVIRFYYGEISIDGLSSLDDLILKITEDIIKRKSDAGVRSLILRYTIKGRGELHSDLMKQDSIQSILRQVNDQFTRSEPFVVVTDLSIMTHGEIDREQLSSQPFFAELFQISSGIMSDTSLKTQLKNQAFEIYQDSKF